MSLRVLSVCLLPHQLARGSFWQIRAIDNFAAKQSPRSRPPWRAARAAATALCPFE